jgi:hypothetical protein
MASMALKCYTIRETYYIITISELFTCLNLLKMNGANDCLPD